MKNLKNKSQLNINKIYNKTQKGILPYQNKKGYLITENTIALTLKKSIILTSLHLKDLKLIISKTIPKYINKYWNLTNYLPRCKRQGLRMGKGKSKIFNICNRLYKSYILLNLKFKFNNFKNLYKSDTKNLYQTYTDSLKEYKKYNYILIKLNKVILKYPQFKIKNLILS